MSLVRSSLAGACLAALLTALCGLRSPAAAGVTQQCFTVAATPAFVTKGEQLRLAALHLSNKAWNAATPTAPKSFTGDAKPCAGSTLPAFAAGAYYGQVSGPAASLRMARVPCDGTQAPLDQFYGIGRAIYHRNCRAGQGIGYITFWGRDDTNESQCFADTYPAMFAEAGRKPPGPVTAERVLSLYDAGSSAPAITLQTDFALANALTAIQIAEVARDYLVLPIDAVLMDRLRGKSPSIAPAAILGGLCPAGVSEGECQNPSSAKGLHPLAWGGAQAVMMGAGAGWGTNNGAMSEFGRDFEAGLLIGSAGAKLTPAPDCTGARAFNAGDPYGRAMMAIFQPLFP